MCHCAQRSAANSCHHGRCNDPIGTVEYIFGHHGLCCRGSAADFALLYHLWQSEQSFATSLVQIDPSIIPTIKEELQGFGAEAVGPANLARPFTDAGRRCKVCWWRKRWWLRQPSRGRLRGLPDSNVPHAGAM